jgi:hypothetical protein
MWNGKVIFFLSFATLACLFATSAPVPSWRQYLTLLIAFLLLSIYLSLQSTMNANNLSGATADDSGGYDVPSPFMEILQSLYPLTNEPLGQPQFRCFLDLLRTDGASHERL